MGCTSSINNSKEGAAPYSDGAKVSPVADGPALPTQYTDEVLKLAAGQTDIQKLCLPQDPIADAVLKHSKVGRLVVSGVQLAVAAAPFGGELLATVIGSFYACAEQVWRPERAAAGSKCNNFSTAENKRHHSLLTRLLRHNLAFNHAMM
eukprot:366367-Chlamydomonas_euryale.AAC.19